MSRKPKEFSIWFVPSNGGRVKKLRITMPRVLAWAAVASVALGSLGFVASDYGRIQLLRASNYFALQMVTRDRDALKERSDVLERELEDLKGANAKVIAYERNLRQRMDEIRATLESATALSFFQAENPTKTPTTKKTNGSKEIGGLETDCVPGKNGCQPIDDARAKMQFGALALSELHSTEDTIESLDETIQLLKRIPLSYPANGLINSGYGYRISPFEKRLKRHEGIDLQVPHGSEVLATADGIVSAVNRTKTYGLMVDIKHSDRVVTRYAHLSAASVRLGEKVCRGETIGKVGSTGRSTGPHLHYEVRFDNRTINPERILALSERLAAVMN